MWAQLEQNRQFKLQLAEQQSQRELQAQQLRHLQQQLAAWKQQAAEFEKQRNEALQSVNLPEDPSLGTHGYGTRKFCPRMVRA